MGASRHSGSTHHTTTITCGVMEAAARCIDQELVADLQVCGLGTAERRKGHALLVQHPGQRSSFAYHQQIGSRHSKDRSALSEGLFQTRVSVDRSAPYRERLAALGAGGAARCLGPAHGGNASTSLTGRLGRMITRAGEPVPPSGSTLQGDIPPVRMRGGQELRVSRDRVRQLADQPCPLLLAKPLPCAPVHAHVGRCGAVPFLPLLESGPAPADQADQQGPAIPVGRRRTGRPPALARALTRPIRWELIARPGSGPLDRPSPGGSAGLAFLFLPGLISGPGQPGPVGANGVERNENASEMHWQCQ
jgi:hypothetical protein